MPAKCPLAEVNGGGAGIFVGGTIVDVPTGPVPIDVLLTCDHGNIFSTRPPVDVASTPGQLEPFQTLLASMTKLEKLDEVKYSSFIVLNFKVVDGLDVYTTL